MTSQIPGMVIMNFPEDECLGFNTVKRNTLPFNFIVYNIELVSLVDNKYLKRLESPPTSVVFLFT